MSTTVDRFPQIMVLIFDLEGPESDNLTTDPNGGLTKFGISQVQHPDVDVANLTPTTATAWYRANMWLPYHCDEMPWPVCLAVFDGIVNGGGAAALQRALGVDDDGIIGSITMAALRADTDPNELTARVLEQRALGYVDDSEWDANGGGWMYRLARVGMAAGGP